MRELKKIPDSWFTKIQQVSIIGTPDILGCVSGKFVAIELKTDTGKLSKLQEYNLDEITKAKGLALVCTESNMNEVLQIIKTIGEALCQSKSHTNT